MKKLHTTQLLVLSLAASDVLAHPGHDTGQFLHGFLHVEHVLYFLAVVSAACVVAFIRSR